MSDDQLTNKQQKALEVLITSGNVTEAAQAAGVTRQTIYLWKEEKEAFQNALQQAASEIFGELALRLVNLGQQAITILQKTLDDPNVPPMCGSGRPTLLSANSCSFART